MDAGWIVKNLKGKAQYLNRLPGVGEKPCRVYVVGWLVGWCVVF